MKKCSFGTANKLTFTAEITAGIAQHKEYSKQQRESVVVTW